MLLDDVPPVRDAWRSVDDPEAWWLLPCRAPDALLAAAGGGSTAPVDVEDIWCVPVTLYVRDHCENNNFSSKT